MAVPGRKRSRGKSSELLAVRRRPAFTVLCCLAILVLLAVIPVFVNDAIGYIPIVAAIVLMALCLAYVAVLKRSLAFDDNPKSIACTRGDTLKFPLKVKNRSLLPAPRIEVVFYVSDIFSEGGRVERQRLTLPPRTENAYNLDVRFDHVGTVEVGILQVAAYDPVGLFSTAKQNFELYPVSITPKRVEIGEIELSDKSLKESSKNIKTFINDGMDYSNVRDYRWGDPMKSIHWKLSSKAPKGSYYTRLYETPTAPGLAIFLDFECDFSDNEALMDAYDAVIESAVSIEAYAVEKGYTTELLFVDSQGQFVRLKGPLEGRYHDLMAGIPRIARGNGSEVVRLLTQETQSAQCQNNLVICSSNVNELVVEACTSIAGPYRFPYFIGVVERGADEDEGFKAARRILDSSRIPYSIVTSASELAGGGN